MMIKSSDTDKNKMDTRLTFADEEYIGNPDDELACEGTANQVSTFQLPEVAPEEFELANGWFLA